MRGRVVRAAQRLADDDVAITAAARELVVHSGQEETQLAAETEVRRIALNVVRQVRSE